MPAENNRVIAVDIGSSNTKIGLVSIGRLDCPVSFIVPTSELVQFLPPVIVELRTILAPLPEIPVIISGSRNCSMIKIGRIIRRVHSGPVTWVRHHTKLPVKFLYMQPDSLGTDRIADALYSAAAYPDKNCIIIDSGTAITVDCVSGAGRFLGGVIIAGADLQLESLHQSTATLPGLSLSKSKIILPGKSTEECMYAGTAHIIAGGLNHIVRTFGKQLGGKCVILATGGAWPLTERLVDFRFIGVPDMTLLGTALYKE